MLALYLIAAHLVGDFILQTRWQAVGKFGWSREAVALRMRHCLTYCVAIAVGVAAAHPHVTARWHLFAFGGLLYVLHYLTDSRRFRSTLGDVVAWWLMRDRNIAGTIKKPGETEQPIYVRLPPNPWAPAPILIDQALHAVQLALLGGLFLS